MAQTSRYNVIKLLVIGFVFHLAFIYSVFDCYFTSPVVHGMERMNAGEAEAKRLVLIIGDGLRADLLFEKNGFPRYPRAPKIVAPHLRAIAEERGAFGISHTRVPTESRPGHVAIIAGMYEDVSAVTRGWKTNPVHFDSVFNQSSHTFAFGSPDIIPMFERGATPGKVKGWTYNEEDEDFTKDATALDVWVLDNFKTMLKNATTDPVLDSQLRGDKVIIFLHLLGLDTTGHSYRPHSPEYMKNIQVVDNIVKETEKLIDDFYGDGMTSYIFTADHGMSVIGNHGDGNPDSTRTPFLTWGKSIRGPLTNTKPSSHDAYSKRWDMSTTYRRDIEQADITPLMATLLGLDWPINSVGVLPDVDPRKPGFLSPVSGHRKLGLASLTNAETILEHYRVKHEQKKAKKFFYKPFKPLEGPANSSTTLPYREHAIQTIRSELLAGNNFIARMEALDVIHRGLEGLRYLETYQRTMIRAIALAAYTGWGAYSSLYVFRPLDSPARSQTTQSGFSTKVHLASFFVFSVFCAMFVLEEAPWTYYLYIAFPCYFWDQTISQVNLKVNKSRSRSVISSELALRAIFVTVALVAMVFGYTHRSIWSVGLTIIGFYWPQATWTQATRDRLGIKSVFWTVSCLSTAIFPLLDVDKEENVYIITAGGFALAAVGSLQAYRVLQNPTTNRSLKNVYVVQVIFIVAMVFITRTSALSLQAKTGLPPLAQASGWIVLIASTLLPFVTPIRHATVDTKMLTHFLGLGPLFVILSISDEVFFFASYSITLSLWVDVETALAQTSESRTSQKNDSKMYLFKMDDLRIVLFFLFFVQVAFFGTGNVASISSFYLAPVYRLIPVFNPFFMAVPLVCKIVSPYIILSLAVASITHALKLPPFSLFLVSLTITDGLTLLFFFNVRDTGSWLEIGQTISFFVITSLLLMWSGGICAIGEYLMVDVFSKSASSREGKVNLKSNGNHTNGYGNVH